MLNRRDFLQFTGLSGVALGAGMVPFQALAQSQSHLNFVFVFNGGGWDPTRVFANCFEQRAVPALRGNRRYIGLAAAIGCAESGVGVIGTAGTRWLPLQQPHDDRGVERSVHGAL